MRLTVCTKFDHVENFVKILDLTGSFTVNLHWDATIARLLESWQLKNLPTSLGQQIIFFGIRMFTSTRMKLIAAAATVLIVACGGTGSSAPPPASGLTLDPGDGQVTVSWAATSGVEYWLAYLAGTTVSLENGAPHTWLLNVSSPRVVTGLVNGTTYAFSVNGRTDGGPGGPGTPSITTVPRPGGATWTAGTPATLGTSALRGLAYGTASDTTIDYLAVGDSGVVFKGTDGINWATAATVSGVNFRAATYGLSKFIAAGSGGQIFYSTDIATWTAANSGIGNTVNVNALASNSTTVVAVGDSGTIRYSLDGATWTAAASVPTGNNLNAVTYSASGLWIAAGANGTLLTSADGSTWTAQTSNTSANLTGVATQLTAGVYTYVTVGTTGAVLKSTDGVSWISATVNPAVDLTAVVVPSTNSQFLAVGAAGHAYTSPDGITWTPRTAGTSANLRGLITAQVQYVAVGDNGVNFNSH